jgi:hypothetical protein
MSQSMAPPFFDSLDPTVKLQVKPEWDQIAVEWML